MKSIMEMMNDSNCSLKQFIYEAKGVYTVNTKDISDLLQKDENFDKSSVFDRSNKTAYLLIYNFDGSKFKKYELQNKPVHNWTLFYTTDDDQQVPKKYFFNPGFLSVGEDTKYPHVSLIKVTKSSKIVILIPSESNEPVIDKIVKDNIDLFTDKGQPNTDITKEDIQIVKDWFEKNVKTYQVIENKGNINIYFPDRDTLKSNELNRVGLNNIPHITISRPPRLKGGFAITLYKSGNWAASEFPNPSKAFNEDGTPKYSNINVVLEVFERNIINGKWKDRLNIELK